CVFFQAEDGIRDDLVTGVQTCALPISSVVAEFPGCPRLLQWMCTGCGSFSWLAAPASASRIFRGVTAVDPSVSSRPLTLRRSPPPFHTATPPGFTILIA